MMDNFLLAIIVILGLMLIVFLWRLVKGPTAFDRLNGLMGFGTNTMLILVIYGQYSHSVGNFVDISIAYAILGFVGLLILAKYYEQKGDIDK